MVEELLNITLGEVGGKSEAQTHTNGELRRRQMDGPGKNGLAKIFGAELRRWLGRTYSAPTRNSSPP